MRKYVDIFTSRAGLLFLGGVGLMLSPYHWAHFIGFILIFQSYDVWGYRDVGKFDVPEPPKGLEEYRVMQFAFQVLFMRLIYAIDGGPTTLACLIAWYLLACDVIYYFSVNRKLEPFDWFLISPVNAINHFIFKQKTPVWAVLASAFVGVAAGLFLTLAER
jgi:hypothetical protein